MRCATLRYNSTERREGQVLGPQKERNINARTGSFPAARRGESAAGTLLGSQDAGEDEDAAASLASRQDMRLITCLRLMMSLLSTLSLFLSLAAQQGGTRMEAARGGRMVL